MELNCRKCHQTAPFSFEKNKKQKQTEMQQIRTLNLELRLDCFGRNGDCFQACKV